MFSEVFSEGCRTPFSMDLGGILEAVLIVFVVRFSRVLQVAQISENRALATRGPYF